MTRVLFIYKTGELGIEPRLTASKAAVLPLDDSPIFKTALVQNTPKEILRQRYSPMTRRSASSRGSVGIAAVRRSA